MVDGHTYRTAVAYIDVRKDHCCDLPSFPKEIFQFIREYFACCSIGHDLLDKVIAFCADSSQQEFLGNALCALRKEEYFPLRRCHRNALKCIIKRLEERHIEITCQLYSALTDSMIENADFVQRLYFDDAFTKYIVLGENRYQLSQGTTGLSCWQASCDLANYLLKIGRNFIAGHDVLELGAGCGLVGIAAAASGLVKSITFSDGNENVLNIIRDNISENFQEEHNCSIRVISLQWEAVSLEVLPVIPNVIIAADVVYDPSAINPLISVITKLLVASAKHGNSTDPCCIAANTLRNEDTMKDFLTCADQNGLLVEECFTYQNNIFSFANENVNDESLFPFTASVQCPTVFHKLILKDSG